MKTQSMGQNNFLKELFSIGDHWIITAVIGLVLFGYVMVYSSSAVMARLNYHNQFYFLWRQGIGIILGLGLLITIIWIGYSRLNNPIVVYSILVACVGFLTVVLFLPAVKGTHRFIRFFGFSFQPSEFAKITLTIFLAYLLSRCSAEERRNIWKAFIPCTLVTAMLMALVLKGQDLGTVFIMALTIIVMFFVSEVPLRYPLFGALAAVPIILYEVIRAPYRLARLRSFMDPWKYARNEGFQVVQSLIAIGCGGASGCGLSEGKQKLFYLPEAHTDFIFAVVGEELGFIGAFTVVALFVLIAWRGLKIANSSEDTFGSLLTIGLTVMLVAQAFFNISVVLSLVPPKGIPLPFISYGGTSMVISLATIGLILSVSQRRREV